MQTEGQFLLVFETGLEDELEGTDPFAQWVWWRVCQDPPPRPDGVQAEDCQLQQRQVQPDIGNQAGCEEQLMICMEANDSP